MLPRCHLDKGLTLAEIFPDAGSKYFITADPEVRAKRRLKQLADRSSEITYEAVLENILRRDHLDATREYSPMRIAKDAIFIDTTSLSIENTVSRIYEGVVSYGILEGNRMLTRKEAL